jgi:hypothetical protein
MYRAYWNVLALYWRVENVSDRGAVATNQATISHVDAFRDSRLAHIDVCEKSLQPRVTKLEFRERLGHRWDNGGKAARNTLRTALNHRNLPTKVAFSVEMQPSTKAVYRWHDKRLTPPKVIVK